MPRNETEEFNLTERLMAWEDGELDEPKEDELFQRLVDSGLALQLQGMYGRRAVVLIQEGRIRDTHHFFGR